ncbi:MAG: beta strand repeat-containing protein, partial [Gemmatimonadaceae bacterium]
DNRGTMLVDAATTLTRGGADHVNTGLIEVNGNLTLDYSGASPSFTNSGTMTVVSGSTLATRTFVGTTAATFTQAAGATLNGGGAMTFNSMPSAVFETGFTLSALSITNTTASFATDISTSDVALTLSNAVINGPGTLTNPDGETLTFLSTTINAPVVNAGTMESVLASTINGPFTAAAGSLLKVRGVATTVGTLNVASGFTNEGKIELTSVGNVGATLVVHSGPLVNAAGGTIHAAAGAGGTRTLNAHFDNRGTMLVDAATTLTRGSADHVNTGLIELNGNLTLDYSGSTPSFTNSGTITIAAGRSWTIRPFTTEGNSVVQTNGATMTGAGTFDPGTLTAFTNAGSVTLALVRIGDGFSSTGTFAPTTVEFYGGTATIPVGAGYTYNNVRVLNAASFAGSVGIAGDLTVAGSGNLNIAGNQVTVAGNFATQNTSFLIMQNAAGVLDVAGNASFSGATTNTRLTMGTLRVGGNFSQAGTAAAFAPSNAHLTVLDGVGPQAVSFASPGTTTALSHFHRLEIQSASVSVASAVFANGQLRTPAGSGVRTVSSTGHTLQVAGLDAAGLVFDNTALRVVNGEAITRFDDATFRNMNTAATQLRLDRSADAVTFNNLNFQTVPTTGLYLHLVDTDAATSVFSVTMQGTQPAVHGGFVLEDAAQLIGWPMS